MVSKRTANLKHSQYYADALLSADQLYTKGGVHTEKGLKSFDENWKNIELGQQWAEKNTNSDDDAATLTSEYPERGAHCLYLRQKPAERISWLESALQVAHQRGFELVEGTLHGKIGLAFAEMGGYQKAVEHYSKRLELAERLKDLEGLGEGACSLGILYDSLNMLEQAQECYQYALGIADEISNSKISEIATGNLGLVYMKQSQFDQALSCFEQHLHLARQNGDQWGEGNALTNKGIASLRIENYQQALECFQLSTQINERLGDLNGKAKNLSYIGATLSALGDLDGAANALEARISIAQKLYDHRGRSIGYWNLGEILIRQKNYRKGLDYLKKCVEYEKSVNDPAWENDLKVVKKIEESYGVQKNNIA
jgi:tetratricopeptide (TPR) repeat protein